MSEILKVIVDHMIADRPTWWVILDCGHWYHWTGTEPPHSSGSFPCPSDEPIEVITLPVEVEPVPGVDDAAWHPEPGHPVQCEEFLPEPLLQSVAEQLGEKLRAASPQGPAPPPAPEDTK